MATTRFKHDNPPVLERRDATSDACSVVAHSSAASEAPISIDEASLAALIAFFRLLDKWDQEARTNENVQ